MEKVRKAIIPAAGLGTRFLPATKAMPKEMLPIIDRPTIEFIVEEAVRSGIKEIMIVTGKGKRAIEDHFDNNFELEQNLILKDKMDILSKVRYSSGIDVHYIRQKEPKGLGHAIWSARHFVGNEPFAVLLGDDIIKSEEPCLKQLIHQFEQNNSSIIGVQEVPREETNRYGIIDPISNENGLYKVKSLVEKPKTSEAPSNIAIMGRYILTPEIFNILENQKPGAGGEIQLTDALVELNKIQNLYAYEYQGKRFDVGEKIGFIKTTIEFALENEELNEEVFRFMKDMIQQYEKKANR